MDLTGTQTAWMPVKLGTNVGSCASNLHSRFNDKYGGLAHAMHSVSSFLHTNSSVKPADPVLQAFAKRGKFGKANGKEAPEQSLLNALVNS